MKHVILEFIGGAWDGMNLSNHSPDSIEARLAAQTYQTIEAGAEGRQVIMPLDYAVRKTGSGGCEYRVVNRTEIGEEVLVRLECVCESPACACSAQPVAKRIVISFQGGNLDGRILDSSSPDTSDALLAAAYYCITHEGQIGARLNAISVWWNSLRKQGTCCTPGYQCHYEYVVLERIEMEKNILIRLGTAQPEAGDS